MMLSRSNWLILGLSVLAAGAGGYVEHLRHHTVPRTPVAIGQPLPALVLSDLDGKRQPLSDYRGHRLLLNFWATWCTPCRAEMPALQMAQEKFAEHGPIVVGIAMDDADRVRRFLAVHPVNYPILIGSLSAPSTSTLAGNVHEVLPYSVLVAADGSIIATHEGELSSAQLEQWMSATGTDQD